MRKNYITQDIFKLKIANVAEGKEKKFLEIIWTRDSFYFQHPREWRNQEIK